MLDEVSWGRRPAFRCSLGQAFCRLLALLLFARPVPSRFSLRFVIVVFLYLGPGTRYLGPKSSRPVRMICHCQDDIILTLGKGLICGQPCVYAPGHYGEFVCSRSPACVHASVNHGKLSKPAEEHIYPQGCIQIHRSFPEESRI